MGYCNINYLLHSISIPFVSLTDRFISVRRKAAVLLVNTVIGEVNKTV